MAASEPLLRSLVGAVEQPAAAVDAAGRVLHANARWREEATAGEGPCAPGGDVVECWAAGLAPAERLALVARIRETLRGERDEFAFDPVAADGSATRVRVVHLPDAGEVAGLVLLSQRGFRFPMLGRSADRASRWRALEAEGSVLFTESTLDGICTYSSSAVQAILGYSPQEMQGRNLYELIHPDDVGTTQRTAREIAETERPAHATIRLRHRDGSWRWLSGTATLFRTFSGERRLTSAVRDATPDRILADGLLETANILIVVLDGDGRIVQFNSYMERISGYRLEEVRGADWMETFVPEEHRERIRGVFAQTIQEVSTQGEVNPIVTKDGSWREIEWHNRMLRNADGTLVGVLAVGQDVTERRSAEDAKLRLDAILESSADSIFIIGLDGIVRTWNPGAERMHGWTRDEIVGRPVTVLLSPPCGAELAGLLARIARAGGIQNLEDATRTRDGRPIDLQLTVCPIRDSSGRIVAAAAIGRDVTERRQLEERLRQAHKLEALGRLAAGVAHDFNNLLTAIVGSSELLLDRFVAEDPRRRAVERILQAAERGGALTERLLAFGRRQHRRARSVELNRLVLDASGLLERLVGAGVALKYDLDPAAGSVLADPSQIDQVLFNLVVNAGDAMPGGGEVRIATAEARLAPAEASLLGVVPGDYAVLSVSDTGCGMDTETLRRIFEPFFTTKGPGRGTGLGLSTAYGIVEQGRGAIAVDSVPGRGSSFRVYLPREAGPGSGEAAEAPEWTVLLVDDDPLVRDLGTDVLEQEGFRVVAAASGAEALIRAAEEEVDILVTDVVMPEMDGYELASRLRAVHSGLPVVYVSAYPERTERSRGAPEGAWLRKPFGIHELVDRVRTTLALDPAS